MKVGIIGGTGGMGKGFALRWSLNHDVIIGSRDATRAVRISSRNIQKQQKNLLETLKEQFQEMIMYQSQKIVMY